jgi:hypothetical protein
MLVKLNRIASLLAAIVTITVGLWVNLTVLVSSPPSASEDPRLALIAANYDGAVTDLMRIRSIDLQDLDAVVRGLLSRQDASNPVQWTDYETALERLRQHLDSGLMGLKESQEKLGSLALATREGSSARTPGSGLEQVHSGSVLQWVAVVVANIGILLSLALVLLPIAIDGLRKRRAGGRTG